MSDRIRIGVLGCASIAWKRTLPAFAEVPELELVAIASRDFAKAKRFTSEFGGEPVRGYQALLDRDDVDAVYVPLPTGRHHEWVAKALRAGKHTLAEKPLATNLTEATELVDLARSSGLLLRENFMFLHHAQHEAVRGALRDNRIGELRAVTAVFGIPPLPPDDVRYRRALGGGALLDVGVYPLRVASHLLGTDLRVVGAVARVDPASGVDLHGEAMLLSGSGVSVHIGFGFDRHYRNTYELWGSAGRIAVERAFTPPATMTPTVRIERPDATTVLDLPADDQFRNISAAFARDVLAKATVDDPGAEGAVNAADAMLDQAALVDAVRAAANHNIVR